VYSVPNFLIGTAVLSTVSVRTQRRIKKRGIIFDVNFRPDETSFYRKIDVIWKQFRFISKQTDDGIFQYYIVCQVFSSNLWKFPFLLIPLLSIFATFKRYFYPNHRKLREQKLLTVHFSAVGFVVFMQCYVTQYVWYEMLELLYWTLIIKSLRTAYNDHTLQHCKSLCINVMI